MLMRTLTLSTVAALAALPALAQDDGTERTLAIFAHPDDELFVAPALARAAREGEGFTLVYATSGDQGPGVSNLERGGELAKRREGEALCAAEALGIKSVRFLRLGDGTLGVNAHHPGSSAITLTKELKAMLENEQFSTVVTWGPDGGYGHSDHRMVSVLTTQLVQAMDEDRPTLIFPGIRKGTLPPVPEMQFWAESDPELLDLAPAYDAEDLQAATKAAQCHETQFDAETRAGMMTLFDQSIWQGSVHFRRALKD